MNIARLLATVCLGVITLAATEGEPQTIQTVVRGAALDGVVTQYLVALPHIAFGGGWRTQIVITNTSNTAADVTLNYFDDNGNPLNVPIGGLLSTSTTVTVPANGQKDCRAGLFRRHRGMLGWPDLYQRRRAHSGRIPVEQPVRTLDAVHRSYGADYIPGGRSLHRSSDNQRVLCHAL